MLKAAFMIPMMLGIFAVLQNTLNKKIAGMWGLSLVGLANGAGLLIASSAVFFLTAKESRLQIFNGPALSQLKFLWVFIPGLLGIFLVIGIPWSIGRLGLQFAFASFIAAQIVTTVLWETLVEKNPTSPFSYIGAAFSVLGAVFFSMASHS